jgi:hypothetical protein
VSTAVSTSENHSGVRRAWSYMSLQWFLPRGVEMNTAQPSFSSSIGRW